MDYELLKQRRARVLKLRAETEQEQTVGIACVQVIDGCCYPVLSCFPIAHAEDAHDKLRYLITGEKGLDFAAAS